MNCYYERPVLALKGRTFRCAIVTLYFCHSEGLQPRGICFYYSTGEQQIPRYARDDNSSQSVLLLLGGQPDLLSVTISLKSAMVENSLNKSRSSARRLARTVSSSTMTMTLSKNASTGCRKRLI
jgi:hypothetical protein